MKIKISYTANLTTEQVQNVLKMATAAGYNHSNQSDHEILKNYLADNGMNAVIYSEERASWCK